MFPFFCFSQQWDQASNFTADGRHHPITFANDNYGFVVSGSYLDDVYKYDKANDTWSQLQDIPFIGRGYSYGVTIGDKAYLGFGSSSSGLYPTDWWEYDMTNDVWLEKSSFPGDGRNHPAMVTVNDKIYIGCGSNNNGNLGDWWEYDILADTWSQRSSFIGNNRHHPFYFGIGNFAYVGFGHGSLPGPGSNPSASVSVYNDFYRYNPTTDSWTQLADFPSEARVAGTQFSYNGKGYVLSGDGDNHGPLSTGEFWEYDPLTELWIQLPSHPGGAIWAPGNFVIGCDVYFLLGQDNNSSFPTFPISVYTYKLSQDCGCTDSVAYNFSNVAIADDGSCCYISGCTDPLALNYNNLSCYDDGSCIIPILGCTNPNAQNFDPNANTTVAFGGAIDNTFASGGYFNGNQYLIFDSNKECIIKSAVIYAESSNTITFELRDSGGNVIDDTTLNVISGQQTVTLNFGVPIDTDMQLGVANNALQINGLYRNNSGASYPYDIASAINITSSSANGNNALNYYYYYYDIEVEIACDASTALSWDCDGQGSCYDPGTGLGSFTTLSSCQNSCVVPSWDCDDFGNCFDPVTGNGQYNSLTDCQLDCTSLSNDGVSASDFQLYPNPTQSECIISAVSIIEKIRLFDFSSRVCLLDFPNSKTAVLDVGSLAKGVYIIEVRTKNTIFKNKIIIE
jgi:N-acetylneuraminic acid mutarotase